MSENKVLNGLESEVLEIEARITEHQASISNLQKRLNDINEILTKVKPK